MKQVAFVTGLQKLACQAVDASNTDNIKLVLKVALNLVIFGFEQFRSVHAGLTE